MKLAEATFTWWIRCSSSFKAFSQSAWNHNKISAESKSQKRMCTSLCGIIPLQYGKQTSHNPLYLKLWQVHFHFHPIYSALDTFDYKTLEWHYRSSFEDFEGCFMSVLELNIHHPFTLKKDQFFQTTYFLLYLGHGAIHVWDFCLHAMEFNLWWSLKKLNRKMFSLLWIIHRLQCQQFSVEMVSTKEIVQIITVTVDYPENLLLLNFSDVIFFFFFYSCGHKNKFHSPALLWGGYRNLRDTYLRLLANKTKTICSDAYSRYHKGRYQTSNMIKWMRKKNKI